MRIRLQSPIRVIDMPQEGALTFSDSTYICMIVEGAEDSKQSNGGTVSHNLNLNVIYLSALLRRVLLVP